MRNSRQASAGGSLSVPARGTAGQMGEGAEFGECRHPEVWGEEGGCLGHGGGMHPCSYSGLGLPVRSQRIAPLFPHHKKSLKHCISWKVPESCNGNSAHNLQAGPV